MCNEKSFFSSRSSKATSLPCHEVCNRILTEWGGYMKPNLFSLTIFSYSKQEKKCPFTHPKVRVVLCNLTHLFSRKNAKYAQNFSSSIYIVIVRWYYSQILLNIYPLTIVILFCYSLRWIARRPKKSLTCPFIVILYSCTFFDTQLVWSFTCT